MTGIGISIENPMGDLWVMIYKVISELTAFILTPDEVKTLAHREEKEGGVSF